MVPYETFHEQNIFYISYPRRIAYKRHVEKWQIHNTTLISRHYILIYKVKTLKCNVSILAVDSLDHVDDMTRLGFDLAPPKVEPHQWFRQI